MALLSPSLLVLGLSILFISYIWTCLTSPLRKIPGPKLASFSSLAIKWHEFHANRTRYVHRLHEIYGPVVRLAPNEVSFASVEGVKEIYSSGGSGYDKTEFYNLFRVYGKRTMFSTLNKNDHAKKKRILADRYANTNIMRSVSLDGIKERSDRFIDQCSASVGGTLDIFVSIIFAFHDIRTDKIVALRVFISPASVFYADLLTDLHAYAFDCISHHLFHPYGSDAIRNQDDAEIMKEVTFDDSLQNRLIQYYNPTLHGLIGGLLSIFAKPRETPLADDLVLSATAKTDPATFTLLSRMEEKGHDLEHLDMAAECLDHMAAGIDTTGDALCFLMWEISQPRSRNVQKRLQEEIQANRDTTPDRLPYLEAVVLEGLRCFPAIPMSLPRYVPSGGRTVDGYFIPEKTIVSSQAFSTHRINQDVFPEPNTFNPDRWLDATGDKERKQLFFAFASGGRGCVGKHLALAEMKTLLVDVYSRFTTLPDESMAADMMEMSDQLISSQPLGKKCLMKFVPLDAGN